LFGCASAAVITVPNGTLEYTYDVATSKIVFNAHVKAGSYIAFGWGSTMSNTDMVLWRANGAGSTQLDLYSTSYSIPSTDGVNTYTTTFTDNGAFVDFVSKRSLNGNGGAQDFVA
jgi:hypothetical protein